jgi:hypothetical protein
MTRLISDKLITHIEDNANRIAQQWCNDVRKNAATPSYHPLPEDSCAYQARTLYHQLGHLVDYKTPREEFAQFFTGFAEARFDEGLPLSEVIYALTLMRRRLWLAAEQENVFSTPIELQQALEFINRVILIFDRAIHIVTQRYEGKIKREPLE